MRISDWSSDVCSSDLIDFGLGVEAHVGIVLLHQLAGYDRAVMDGVLGDLANRGLQRTTDDVDTAGLVVIGALQAIQRPGGIEQRSAAAGNDAFLNGRAGGVKRVVDAILALLHFDFRSAAALDHPHAARKLGETLLQLFTVIVRRSRLDLRADLLDPALDALGFARTIDKGDRKSTRLNSRH